MSASVREAIAGAANAVPGVNVTPYYRQITKAGEGTVRLDRIDYPNAFGGLATWQVLIVLPPSIDAAERWLDANSEALRGALAEQLALRSLAMAQLSLPDAGSIPAVVIEGQREQE